MEACRLLFIFTVHKLKGYCVCCSPSSGYLGIRRRTGFERISSLLKRLYKKCYMAWNGQIAYHTILKSWLDHDISQSLEKQILFCNGAVIPFNCCVGTYVKAELTTLHTCVQMRCTCTHVCVHEYSQFVSPSRHPLILMIYVALLQ